MCRSFYKLSNVGSRSCLAMIMSYSEMDISGLLKTGGPRGPKRCVGIAEASKGGVDKLPSE